MCSRETSTAPSIGVIQEEPKLSYFEAASAKVRRGVLLAWLRGAAAAELQVGGVSRQSAPCARDTHNFLNVLCIFVVVPFPCFTTFQCFGRF